MITYSDLESECEYDESKSRSNEEKHGIDFKEAQRLWDGVYVKLNARKRGERRFLYIGVIDGWQKAHHLGTKINEKRGEAVCQEKLRRITS